MSASLRLARLARAAAAWVVLAGAARADDCASGVDCACTPPASPSQQAIDLGRYQGIVALYDVAPAPGQRAGVRLECSGVEPCLCAFPADFQIRDEKPDSGRYRLAFTGVGPAGSFPDTSVGLGATAQGALLIDEKAHLAPALFVRGARVRLSGAALRSVRVRIRDSSLRWGLEYWKTRSYVDARLKATRVIADVTYFLTLSRDGFGAGGALFVVDRRGRVTLGPAVGDVSVPSGAPGAIDIGRP